jgi:hypothetical protein
MERELPHKNMTPSDIARKLPLGVACQVPAPSCADLLKMNMAAELAQMKRSAHLAGLHFKICVGYKPFMKSEIVSSKLVAKTSTVAMEATLRAFSSWLMKILPKPEISDRYAWLQPRFVRNSRIRRPNRTLISIATFPCSGYPEG